jgi:hypothetical protein
MSRQPTPQSISALLRKAGFTRAVVRIRGGISGYRVSNADPGTVWVWHYTMFGTRTSEAAKRAQYAETITSAGYVVEDDTGRDRLIVAAEPLAASGDSTPDGGLTDDCPPVAR